MTTERDRIDQDAIAIGDIRDSSIFRSNCKADLCEIHEDFLNKITEYCKNNNIDLVFAQGPTSLYIPLDKSSVVPYMIRSRRISLEEDNSLLFQDLGCVFAERLIVSITNIKWLSLYKLEPIVNINKNGEFVKIHYNIRFASSSDV